MFAGTGYSAQATAHPATCLFACLLARLFCPGYSACPFAGQATAHPATCLPSCLLAAQATLPRLLNTLPPACLSVCWTGYSAQATAHPATCLPACLLARLLCPGYCTPCHCLPACLLPRLLCPGYCTLPPACLFAARLLCPGYCTPCHLPACLFAGQATLPRLLHTLPPACLPVCWPGYSAQANHTLPDCLPAWRAGQATVPRLLPAQATLPRLLHTLPPACLPVCWPGYSAQLTAA